MSFSYHGEATTTATKAFAATVNTVDHSNINLTAPQKELVKWHERFGHLSLKKIQFLMLTGILAHTEEARRLHTAATKTTHPPMCAACKYGKQKARPTPGKVSTIVKDKQGALSQDQLHAGQSVSMDHFICSTPGCRFDSKGKSQVLKSL
mmetsp:Transcript_28020/g.77081  ORF Transcript_28020/g.77081 Transcript_28020/m.77081 type:complete len:150 (-) Transcript_28020:49-498(-)